MSTAPQSNKVWIYADLSDTTFRITPQGQSSYTSCTPNVLRVWEPWGQGVSDMSTRGGQDQDSK